MRPLSPDPLVWTPAIVAGVLASLSLYLNRWGSYMKFMDRVATYWDYNGDTFDFIVIGAGSSGGVVASRLAQYYRVLLLEAGGRINPMQTIPAMSLLMLNYPEIDWKHKTVPQKYSCFGLPHNKSHWSQGKGLGGTSNLNFLIQSRGNPRDFDNWANLTGDKSWSYANLLPYFRKTEDFHGRWANARTHGKGGPVKVSLPEYTGMGELYVQAANELGYPRQDLNGYFTEGFDVIYYPIKNGRRYGIFSGFIEEAMLNLEKTITVRQFAYVKKILIDGQNRAYGVEYDWHGKTEYAYAQKEVILSAGAMMSPTLLQLSGIGPKKHLQDLGIEVRADLPVGKNLQDHISAYLGPFFVNQPITFSIERDITSISVANFFVQGRGILTTSGTNAMGFFSSSYAKARGEPDWPDVQIILAGVSVGENFARDFARGFGVKRRVLERYWAHAVGKDSFLQIVSLGRPNARGDIKLQNTDPYTPALIDPNYLDNQEDLDILVEGIKKAVDLVEKTRAFAKYKGHFTEIPFPGCENIPFRTDEYWECYATHFSVTLHHIVGSCSMGKNTSKDAVVDTQLRVIGIEGLRVIDASVMPVVVVGNTNAPAIVVGEKGADMILQTYEDERHEAIRLAEEKRKQQAASAAAAAAAAQQQAQQAPSSSSTPTPPPTQPAPATQEPDTDDYDYDSGGGTLKKVRADLRAYQIKEQDVRKLDVSTQEAIFLNSYYNSNKEFFERASRNLTRFID